MCYKPTNLAYFQSFIGEAGMATSAHYLYLRTKCDVTFGQEILLNFTSCSCHAIRHIVKQQVGLNLKHCLALSVGYISHRKHVSNKQHVTDSQLGSCLEEQPMDFLDFFGSLVVRMISCQMIRYQDQKTLHSPDSVNQGYHTFDFSW